MSNKLRYYMASNELRPVGAILQYNHDYSASSNIYSLSIITKNRKQAGSNMFATSCFVLSSINQYSFMYGNYGTIYWPLMLGNSNTLSEALDI